MDEDKTMHLDDDLLARVASGDPTAVEIKKATERLERAAEVLLNFGVCADCICGHLSATIDILQPPEVDYADAA
jgi:hypothetical protein